MRAIGALMVFLFVAWVSLAGAQETNAPAASDVPGVGFDAFADEFGAAEPPAVSDPLEVFNRGAFVFNDKLYFWFLKPVASTYRWVVPQGVRVCTRRCFDNLAYPARFVSNVFQGKFKGGAIETARFGVNSTIGLLGLFDPAEAWLGLSPPPEEDFGQTLGHYGVGSGAPLMLPLLGPSNTRDVAGRAVDFFLKPLRYVHPSWVSYTATAGERLNETSLRIGEYESFKKQAIDPYTFVRDAYRQYRSKQVEE